MLWDTLKKLGSPCPTLVDKMSATDAKEAKESEEQGKQPADDGSSAEHWPSVALAVQALSDGVGEWSPVEGEPPRRRKPARRIGLCGVALGGSAGRVSTSCRELAAALAAAAPTLQKLTLQRNDGHGGQLGAEGAIVIAETLRGAMALEALYMTHNGIGDRGAAALAAALRGNKALRRLVLCGNGIGDAGATRLAAIVPTLPALELLNLGGGDEDGALGAQGRRALAGSAGR